MKAKTLYRLVDSLAPRMLMVALFIVTLATCLNSLKSIVSGDFKSAAIFGGISFLLAKLTELFYTWKNKN
jgi:hypothetical protein